MRRAAAWMHGRSAARLAPGLIAEDVVDEMPMVIAELRRRTRAGLAVTSTPSEI